ncbi:MAG: hypothetical protein SGBAC_001390 [Bacillariaceae sp.]
MFAMKGSTSNGNFQEGTGLDINPAMSFDLKQVLSLDDDSMMGDFLDICGMGDDDRDAEPSSSRSIKEEPRDGPMSEQINSFSRVEEPATKRTCKDFGSMPYYPVDTKRGDDYLGLTPSYLPKRTVTRFNCSQQPDVVTSDDAHITPYSSASLSRHPVEELPSEYCGSTSPFHDVNENNHSNHAMIQQPRTPVALAPIPVRSAFVPITDSRTASPAVGFPREDYTAAWQQQVEPGFHDFFAEVVPQRNGVETVSIPDLGLLGNHRIIKTQFGPAVLLDPKDPNNANITSLQHATIAQPPSFNVLGARHSNADNSSNRKFQRWSPEEDDVLKNAVETEGGPPINWKRIASKYFSNVRTALQCKSRWTKSLKPGILKGAWTPEEDACILRYKQEGLKLSEIAQYLPGRIGEHICDRYNNVLDPELKKTPWTKEEDRILFLEQRRLGNKWTQISRLIPGRSENSVKNRWHNLKVTRQRRERGQVQIRKRQADNRCTAESPQDLSSNGNSPQYIDFAPPSDASLRQEFAVGTPDNVHTIFRSTPSPPARRYQV